MFQLTISINEAQTEALYALLNRFISSTNDEDDFGAGIELFVIDEDFADYYNQTQSYIGAFNIRKVEIVDNTKSKYNPVKAPLKDGLKISINNKYIYTELNLEKKPWLMRWNKTTNELTNVG